MKRRAAIASAVLSTVLLAGCGVSVQSEPVPLTEPAQPEAPTPVVTSTTSVPPPSPPPTLSPDPTPMSAPSVTRNPPPPLPITAR